MKISDAYGKLDRRCVFAIRQKSEVFRLISKLGERIQTYLYDDDEGAHLQLFFEKSTRLTRDLSVILARKDVIEKSNFYSISEKLDNISGLSPVSRILEMASVLMNGSHVFGDELFVDFSFHHSLLKEVNGMLSEFTRKDKNFRIAGLERTRTLKNRLMENHEKTPVAVIRYSVKIPRDIKVANFLMEHDPGAVAEIETRHLTGTGVRVLIYATKALDFPDVHPISREENLYEGYFYEKTLIEGRRRGNEARIPRLAYFITIEGQRMIDTTFVPAAEADEYIRILMSLGDGAAGSRPVLEYYSLLDDEVWDWL